MPRRHALFCIIDPDQRGHGLFCVSRPVARPTDTISEAGAAAPITIDLAVRWTDPDGQRLVRVVGGPPTTDRPFIAIMTSGGARQLAAALLVAAGQAEELKRDVTRPRPTLYNPGS
jgi:hypothetical protein